MKGKIILIIIFVFQVFLYNCSKDLIKKEHIYQKEIYIDIYKIIDTMKIDTQEVKVLKGKRIVIDPGHGGFFKGAVGLNLGIKEKDINLKVALYLKRLLEKRGAKVFLTRDKDIDFIKKGENVRVDLKRRLEKVQSIDSIDLFISIHHNASASLNRDEDGIYVFYKYSDPYRSLEASKSIIKYMKKSLKVSPVKVKMGNYFVLRTRENIPSILGEYGYLTNPKTEKFLSEDLNLLNEAISYLKGIVDFFSDPIPQIENIKVLDTKKDIQIKLLFNKSLINNIIKIKFDNQKLSKNSLFYYFVSPKECIIFIKNVEKGNHRLILTFESINGSYSKDIIIKLSVYRKTKFISLYKNDSGYVSINKDIPIINSFTLKVFDKNMSPIKEDTIKLKIIPDNVEYEENIIITNYQTTSYLSFKKEGKYKLIFYKNNDTLYTDYFFVKKIDGLKQIYIENKEIKYPLFVYTKDTTIIIFNRLFNVNKIEADSFYINSIGYYGRKIKKKDLKKGINIIKLTPIFERTLFNRRITIDPACGGDDCGFIDSLFNREGDITLHYSKILKQLFILSGAKVLLTREDNINYDDAYRLLKNEQNQGEIFIRINSSFFGDKIRIITYKYSLIGDDFANILSYYYNQLGYKTIHFKMINFILQQVSAPVIIIDIPRNLYYKKDYYNVLYPILWTSAEILSNIKDFKYVKLSKTYKDTTDILKIRVNYSNSLYIRLDNTFDFSLFNDSLKIFKLSPGYHEILFYNNNNLLYKKEFYFYKKRDILIIKGDIKPQDVDYDTTEAR